MSCFSSTNWFPIFFSYWLICCLSRYASHFSSESKEIPIPDLFYLKIDFSWIYFNGNVILKILNHFSNPYFFQVSASIVFKMFLSASTIFVFWKSNFWLIPWANYTKNYWLCQKSLCQIPLIWSKIIATIISLKLHHLKNKKML
jgi:hypothetical protein